MLSPGTSCPRWLIRDQFLMGNNALLSERSEKLLERFLKRACASAACADKIYLRNAPLGRTYPPAFVECLGPATSNWGRFV